MAVQPRAEVEFGLHFLAQFLCHPATLVGIEDH